MQNVAISPGITCAQAHLTMIALSACTGVCACICCFKASPQEKGKSWGSGEENGDGMMNGTYEFMFLHLGVYMHVIVVLVPARGEPGKEGGAVRERKCVCEETGHVGRGIRAG